MSQYNQGYYQDNRYGASAWAEPEDIKRANMLKPKGLRLGFLGDNPLYRDSDASLITIAGAGAGKGRDVLVYNACCYPSSMLINDPKGELCAISLYHQHKLGIKGYCINPFGLHGLPEHKLNPLDVLRPDSKTFYSDAKVLAQNLITPESNSGSKFFDKRSQEWIEKLMIYDALKHGQATLSRVYGYICMIEGNPSEFVHVIEEMQQSGNAELVRVAGEIIYKQMEAPKEFTAITSTIYNAFSFMAEPAINEMLEGGDFSLEALCDKNPVKVYMMIPAEYMAIYAPLIRLIFTVGMLYKRRSPSSPRVVYLVDEAGQLGKFGELIQSFTYGRGCGVRTWAVFQDKGQIIRNFGHEGITTFLSSAETQQYFGVRDYDTARMISDTLGNQTLHYDEPLQKNNAKMAQFQAVSALQQGAEPSNFVYNAMYHGQNAEHQHKQSRPLLTADEIMNMPEDQQILIVSGVGFIQAQKQPYYTRSEMAGKYLQNPYHPPVDKVQVQGRLGKKRVKVLEGTPPRKYKDWAQFQKGCKYVKGYK